MNFQDYAVGQLIGGRYRLIDRVAIGGMGELWRAELERMEGFRRPVAIKRILPAYFRSEQHQVMFRREAVLTARLSHPNIAQVMDFGEDARGRYIVTEWIDGVTLKTVIDLLQQHKQRPSLSLSLAVVIAVLRALSAAHEHCERFADGTRVALPVIHRDATPSNIMLSVDGVTKLVDFGLAKLMDDCETTPVGMVKGKLRYLAPEILHGAPFSAASDVYAVAVVLWELLAGERLYTRDTDALRALVEGRTVRSLRALRSDVSPALDAVLIAALQPEPAQRLASARAVADELAALTLTLPDPVSEQRIAADVQTIQRMVTAAPVFVSIPPPLPAPIAPTPPATERRSVAPPTDHTEAIALVRRVDRG